MTETHANDNLTERFLPGAWKVLITVADLITFFAILVISAFAVIAIAIAAPLALGLSALIGATSDSSDRKHWRPARVS